MIRRKYTPSERIVIMNEFFSGATAGELSEKYGVKKRTLYYWSQLAKKQGDIEALLGKQGANKGFAILNRISSLEEKVKNLEEKVGGNNNGLCEYK